MRNLVILLVVVVAVGAGYAGYYSYWHKQAEKLQDGFVKFADTINAGAKKYAPDRQLLKYDSVAVTGFPGAMVLEVYKPVLSVPVSALVKEAELQKGITAPLPYEWVEELGYADKWTLTSDVGFSHFTFTTNGDRTDKAYINKAVRHTIITTTSTPLTCNLHLEKGNGPQAAFADGKSFVAAFRSADCGAKDIVYKDGATGSPIFNTDEWFASVSTEPGSEGGRKASLQLNVSKAKSTPAFDAVLYDYMLMYYTLMGDANELGNSMPLSEYGEQNMKVDVRYDGPVDQVAMASPASTLHFDINSLDFNSSLANFSLTAHVAKTSQGDQRAISFSVHETSEVSEQAEKLAKKSATEILTKLQKQPNYSNEPGMQILQKLANLGPAQQTVDSLYPQFHTMGKTSIGFDLNVKGPNDDRRFLQQASAQLDDLSWVATPYGLRLKGNASSQPGKRPVGDLTINCTSCDALVTDLGAYAMRIEAVVSQMGTVRRPPFLSKDLIDGVKQFLHGIAENSSASDVVIQFSMKDTGAFTVSGKQIPEVMGVYMNTIAPHLPQTGGMGGGIGGQPELSAPPVPAQ